jgi:hypothetical protein
MRRPVAGHAPGGRSWPHDAASMTITAASSEVGRTSAGVGAVGSMLSAGSSGDFDRDATPVPSPWDSTHLDGRRRRAARSSPVAGEVAQTGAEKPRHCRRRWRFAGHSCQCCHVRVHSAFVAGVRGGAAMGRSTVATCRPTSTTPRICGPGSRCLATALTVVPPLLCVVSAAMLWYGSLFYECDRVTVPDGDVSAPARPQAGHP